MAGVNKVILIGNLGNDPEIRNFESGSKVARISIATTEYRNDRQTGQRIEMTEWHNVVLWSGLADVSEKYLHKGSKVYIEGKLRTRSWQDKEGKTNYTTEIVAENMNMLDRKSSGPSDMSASDQAGSQSQPQNQPQTQAAPQAAQGEDDLPF